MLKVRAPNGELIREEKFTSAYDYQYFFDLLFKQINAKQKTVAIGHRVVHGGDHYINPVLVTPMIMNELKALIPFAPLHQPFNLRAIETLNQMHPDLPQIACFDTAFHRMRPPIADFFALPREYINLGVHRYGFHGLSYEYVVKQLYTSQCLKPRTVIAHLGNGASICAVKDGKSYDSTMGFTALDGLMMGTRCGALDPGVVLYLMKFKGMSHDQIENLLYKESGLLGVSGLSSNMQTLLESTAIEAKEAVALFVYRARREIGALAAVLGGVDTIVFTGGIGENAPYIRKAICADMGWLGIEIDDNKNINDHVLINTTHSSVEIRVIPTDEEYVIANHTFNVLEKGSKYG